MKQLNSLLLTLLVVSISTAYAQDDTNTDNHQVSIVIPTIALLDIESSTGLNAISITMATPTEAGDAPADQTNDNLWLNVTSIVAANATRSISVSIKAAVAGLDLKVVAAAYYGDGFGFWGIAKSELTTLSTSSQNLVTGIKSGYTVHGAGSGYQLTYTVSLKKGDTFGNLVADIKNIDVTYTLTP